MRSLVYGGIPDYDLEVIFLCGDIGFMTFVRSFVLVEYQVMTFVRSFVCVEYWIMIF